MIELDRFAWGEVATLDVGTQASCQLGPLRLWARRDPREWTLSYVRDQASLDTTTTVEIPSRTELQVDIKRAFDAAAIEIPFPHRSLYSGSVSEPFPVRLVPDRSDAD